MWVIAAILVCTMETGCTYGTRSETMADRWPVGDTKLQCELRAMDRLVLAMKQGNGPSFAARILCERMGV